MTPKSASYELLTLEIFARKFGRTISPSRYDLLGRVAETTVRRDTSANAESASENDNEINVGPPTDSANAEATPLDAVAVLEVVLAATGKWVC
jgi:hypothetical protein